MNVSIVITILNEEKTINRLLRSLLSQTVQPREIIIVDGGSTDSTLSQIPNKKIIKVFVKPGNRAIGRNYGIKQAKNEIIAITDAGGYPQRDWLEKLTSPFEDKDVLAAAGYYKSIGKNPFEEAVTPYFLVMSDKAKQMEEFLPSARSMAIRKSAWKKVGGFPEEFSHNEDLVFDYRLREAGVNFAFARGAIVYWYPPKNVYEALVKFFRFSFGDAESGISRPKVYLILLRYFIGVAFLLLFPYLLFPMLGLYVGWAILKNVRYVSSLQAVLWLAIIQIIADISVMAGYLAGKLKR